MEQSKAAAQRAAAKKALANGEAADRETYTAKQIALRCGTDPKTMRKFFRSKHSTVEPVGQGGRYEFSAKDFPQIQREFNAWRKKTADRAAELRARKGLPPEPEPEEPAPAKPAPKRKPELPTAFYRDNPKVSPTGRLKPYQPPSLQSLAPSRTIPVPDLVNGTPTEEDDFSLAPEDFDLDFALDELDD